MCGFKACNDSSSICSFNDYEVMKSVNYCNMLKLCAMDEGWFIPIGLMYPRLLMFHVL